MNTFGTVATLIIVHIARAKKLFIVEPKNDR